MRNIILDLIGAVILVVVPYILVMIMAKMESK